MKHDWEVTDNQGHSMECNNCGEPIYFFDNERWNELQEGECRGYPVKTLELTYEEFDWLSESIKLMQNVRNGVLSIQPGKGITPLLAGSKDTVTKIDGVFDSLVDKVGITDGYYKSRKREYDAEI